MAKKQSTLSPEPSGWVGWVYFASALMIISAFFQLFFGFAALVQPDFYAVAGGQLFLLDLTSWGWIHTIWGLVLLTAGISLASGGAWGRVIGVLVVTVALIGNFIFLPVQPWWSIIAIAVDMLILYALLVHGKEAKA